MITRTSPAGTDTRTGSVSWAMVVPPRKGSIVTSTSTEVAGAAICNFTSVAFRTGSPLTAEGPTKG